MTDLAKLVAAYQSDHTKLPAMFDALTTRGPVSDVQHRLEVELLERMRAEGALDPIIVKALLAKLIVLQTAPGLVIDQSDVTMVKPTTKRPMVQDDATVVQPASGSPPPPGPSHDDEVTMVKPASAPPPEGHTASATGTLRGTTGTSSGISSSTSTWQHVSEAQGGDFVAVGSLLKGRFYLEKEIGRGGMGVVFKARDERKVEARDRDPYLAVKVLNDEFRRHPDSLIALQRESRRSQQLAHDNIVRVFDFDKDGTIVFMTMEYIDGSDLKQLIRERAYNGLPLAQARPLIEGMARALARAHAAGVVHSDFKPANVMVTREGVPKVFDFGIARAGKHMGDAVGEQTVFDAGTLGALTPAYASLEMIQGKEPTPADDVYALGCVAFELLTGRHPFDKASAELAMKEGRKPPPVKGLTKAQYKTLCASVAFHGEQRLKTAYELVEGLRDVGLRERAMPYLIYGVPAALLLAGGIWGWITFRHGRHVSEVVGRFTLTRPDHYSNEDQALKALDSLSDDERKRIVIDQSDAIQNFLLSRITVYWDPAKDRYDYAKAQQVFKLRDDMKLYSPALDIKRSAVEKEKNDLLNTLDTQLAQQIQANAIFEDQPGNVVITLAHIRAIDPSSPLLRNSELELKYDTAVGESIDAGEVDKAAKQLKLASSLFPASARLKQRSAQLDDLGKAMAASRLAQQQAQQLQQQRDQSLQSLAGLLDHALNSDAWRNQAAASYRDAARVLGDDPRLVDQAARLKQVLAAQAGERKAGGDLANAIAIAGFGIDLFPGDAALTATRQSLLEQQNQLAQKAATEAQRNALARSRVADLLAQPLGTVVWLQDLRSAQNNARDQMGAASPGYGQVRSDVNAALIKLARARIAAGDLDTAQRVARAGQQLDPAEAGFAQVLTEASNATNAAKAKALQLQAQSIAEARNSLLALGAKPTFTADWQSSVVAALSTLRSDTSPQTQRATDTLAAAIANDAARLADPQHLPQARIEVDFGLKYLPTSAALLAQNAKLDALQKDIQAKLAQESTDAEVKSRIESMRSAAAADDVGKASQSLARIRVLQPDNPFLKAEGPKLLADAYLGLARDTFQKGRFQKAADVLAQGIATLGSAADLRTAKARYDVVAAIMAAGKQPLSAAGFVQLKNQLDAARKADPAGLAGLESDMKIRGQLSGKTLAEQLEKLKPAAAPPAVPGPAAGVPGTGPAPAVSAEAIAVQPASKPGKPGVTPAGKPANASAGGEAAVTGPAGPDPCDRPELVGTGKFCSDTLGQQRGPLLVVVPGIAGGKPFAVSRAEISIIDFNRYCQATGKCTATTVTDQDLGGAPVTRITLAQAKAYAAWLTGASGGYIYRLPSDTEWVHAAKANSGWRQADDSNCIPPTAGGSDGTGAPVSARGRARNPWGLVNMTGNVWEWVTSGGGVSVRGGGFNSYWSDCTTDTHREDDGSAQKDVGFRVLRELK